jgi:hypothetical protein
MGGYGIKLQPVGDQRLLPRQAIAPLMVNVLRFEAEVCTRALEKIMLRRALPLRPQGCRQL